MSYNDQIFRHTRQNKKQGVIIVLSAIMMVVILGMVAFAIDVGFMMVVRTQLQVAADSGALAAGNALYLTEGEIKALARDYVTKHAAGGRSVTNEETEIDFGLWDTDTDTFTPTQQLGNAIRVIAHHKQAPFFFARVFGHRNFDIEAEAIAMVNPRDIAFVVDLSGSMNDDTEPAWATPVVNDIFGSGIGSSVMSDIYSDFGYGTFPGSQQHVGQPFGIKKNKWAYAEMTKDEGPLASSKISSKYRIYPTDNEKQRKQKAYLWMIDNQIAKVMPAAKPTPNQSNYSYWEKYLDYIIQPVRIVEPKPPKPSTGGGGSSSGGSGSSGGSSGGGSSTPKPPPKPKPPKIGLLDPSLPFASSTLLAKVAEPVMSVRWNNSVFLLAGLTGPIMFKAGAPPLERGWIPASQDGDRIDRFNNPNKSTFPSAKSNLPRKLRNKIGYQTYVQFMMDHGRDLRPNGKQYVPLSVESPDCPLHTEATPGGTFSFPPREQPMHAVRRSLIAAIEVARERNDVVPNASNRDQVSIVSFDSIKGGRKPVIHQELTGDYKQAMLAVTKLQAVGDKGASTATDSGLRIASQLLTRKSDGGVARDTSEKIAVLLTDGVPNAFEVSESSIDIAIKDVSQASSDEDNDIDSMYGGGYYWLDSPLLRTRELKQANKADVYPVGVGLGTNYDFMDRLARVGGTANPAGHSPRGSGDPQEYEQILTEIFEKIIVSPTARIVQ